MYKVIFYLIIITFSVFASSPSELMEKGNKQYQKNDFTGAVSTYEQILSSGYESSSLYYNLGNAYYRDGKIGYALLNYERARKLDPNDEDIIHNIALLNTRLLDRIESVPRLFIFEWWDNIVYLFSLNGWTYVTFFIFITLLIIVAVYFTIKQPLVQKYSFFGGLAVLVLLIFSIIILSVNYNRELNSKSGIITANYANVKLSPDHNANDAFVIHEGLKFRIEDKVNNWYRIRLNDGKQGWIQQQLFRII